jgi:hypothetical protein
MPFLLEIPIALQINVFHWLKTYCGHFTTCHRFETCRCSKAVVALQPDAVWTVIWGSNRLPSLCEKLHRAFALPTIRVANANFNTIENHFVIIIDKPAAASLKEHILILCQKRGLDSPKLVKC